MNHPLANPPNAVFYIRSVQMRLLYQLILLLSSRGNNSPGNKKHILQWLFSSCCSILNGTKPQTHNLTPEEHVMFQKSEIFEENYNQYCSQLAEIDFNSIGDTLGITCDGSQMRVRFFNRDYRISKTGIADASGNRPAYGVCVILAKYILLCPDEIHHDPAWVSFPDFKRTTHFTNVNYFKSDTEQVIANHFSGKFGEIATAGEALGGFRNESELPYDLCMQFPALPRISLLLLFNDRDEEFPAHCSVLFQKHAEFYLDPESLAMTSAFLANSLKKSDQTRNNRLNG